MFTTRKQQLDELRRELRMRQQVYRKWVAAGRMKQNEAEHRVNCLIDVIADFEARHAPEKQQGSLGL